MIAAPDFCLRSISALAVCYPGFFPCKLRFLLTFPVALFNGAFSCALYFRRFFIFLIFSFFSLTAFCGNWQYWALRYSDTWDFYAVVVVDAYTAPGYLWVHQHFPELDGHSPYYIKGTDPVIWLDFVMIGQPFESDNVDPLKNYLDALKNKPRELELLDYNRPPSNGLPPLRPEGDIIRGKNGAPKSVVGYDANGNKEPIPLTEVNEYEYRARGYDSQGRPGTYTTNGLGDGMWTNATFVPDSSDVPTDPDEPSDPVVDTSSPSAVPDTVVPPSLDSNGKVETPTTTVTVPNGSGGTVTFHMRDYTPLLSQIAVNQIEDINRRDSSFQQLNENLESIFTSDSPSVSTSDPFGAPDFSSVQAESNEILDQVSGWDFSFGTASNPVGNLITSLFGNPPTSFGSVDQVWDIEFPLFGDVVVRSSFRLSDYFVPAFRSAILMILTIVFAIAVAKQISGAFS